jgi:predicted extracellular nuclease
MTPLRLPGALAAAALLCLSAFAAPVLAQVSLGAVNTPYGENFDSLASTGTTNTDVPAGWAFSEAGTNANGQYRAVSGTSNTGDTLSLGVDTDRAFGTLLSGSLTSTIGASFRNDTGVSISTLAIAYTGEQWRQGGTARFDQMDFQYSLDATSLTTGTWTDVNELDFVAPNGGATTGPLDGNAPANRVAIGHSLEGLALADDAVIWIRWNEVNAAGADDALGIDDFSITANPVGGTLTLSIGSASQAEGDTGAAPMDFTVTLSGPAPAGGVDFLATVTDQSAVAPSDYIAFSNAPYTIPAGQTSTTVSVQIVGDTVPEPDETFAVTLTNLTSGVFLSGGIGIGTIVNDDSLVLEIFEIQGNGLRSPYAPASGNGLGELVGTEANVVTALTGNGFYIQTPDARDDLDAATSNGIFVFTGTAPTVAVGDLVDVVGTVQEFFDWTQLTGVTVTAAGTGTLPTAVVLDETRPSPNLMTLSCGLTNFECFENMLVTVPAGAVVQGNQRFGSDLFGEAFVSASGERTRREKGLLPNVVPPAPGLPVWDGNPEVFELDADGAGAVPPGTPIFGGELFEATGVIAFQFGNYALRASSLTRVEVDLPRPVPASGGDAELRIASQNVLNYCVGSCDPVKLARLADQIGNVLRLPDVVGLQELGTPGAAGLIAARLNTDFGTDYVAYTGSSPFADGIRNGFLVRASRVAVVRTRELDAAVTIDQCSGTPPCVLHDRPPHLLEATFTGGNGERFAVLNNHTRSLIGISEPAPEGPRVRFKRFEQGKSLGRLVQRFQLGQELQPADPVGGIDTQDVPLVLVGDYNAFEVTDGYVDVIGLIKGTYLDSENEYQLAGPNLVDPPLLNLVDDVPEQERYSYTFREDLGALIGESPRQVGSIQVLDHGLVNQAALDWCGSLVYGRGNADAPAELRNTGTGAVGSSDHDGFVLRLFTDRIVAYDNEQPGRCVR